jgi:alcohol dehydrogenase class IV
VDNVWRPGAGLIALPTTAGTGSEATKVVVIADTEAQVKMTGRSKHYVPDVAILDYKLTTSMPKSLTGETGVDALTHAIEAFVSRQAWEATDRFALSAVKLIWDSIEKACEDGANEDARREMLMGSFYAGIAFSNASVGLVHSMSEPLGACFHVPHGLSNAMLLPAVTRFCAAGAPGRYAEIARFVGPADGSASDEECCQALVEGLFELNRRLEIATPKSMGIAEDAYCGQIEKMTGDALAAGSTANNPIMPTAEDIKKTYRNVYE